MTGINVKEIYNINKMVNNPEYKNKKLERISVGDFIEYLETIEFLGEDVTRNGFIKELSGEY